MSGAETAAQQESPYAQPRSFRLDKTSRKLLDKLSEKLGVSQADVVRLSIRRLADIEKVPIDG